MGVESTNSKYLLYLGRHHNYNLVKQKIKLMKEMGFSNINIDLIYGIPNQKLTDLENDLDNILKLGVSHISTYSLMIEPHTVLFINGEEAIDDDLDYEMYKLICQKLKHNGYNHYEISNFAKDNKESKHNLVYWNNLEYYGFGLGASGYLNGIRYTNTKVLQQYLDKNIKVEEKLTKKDVLSYALILGFRKIKGINKQEFFNRYGVDIHNLYNIKELLKKGDLEENNDYIYVKYDKIYVENNILVNFVGE